MNKEIFSGNDVILNFDVNNKFESCQDNIEILIRGYILPRSNACLPDTVPHIMLAKLYLEHGMDCFNYIKGYYVTVIKDLKNKRTIIANDHLGLNSFYYTTLKSQPFQVVSDLNLIKKDNPQVDYKSPVLKALLNREINNQTFLNGVFKSKQATRLVIENGNILIDNYWSPQNLLQPIDKNHDIPFFADLIKKQIHHIKEHLDPKNYCITLTGGKDSRTALAGMLHQGIKPFGFTYGNPESKDATFAKIMAGKAGIDHCVFDPPNDAKWLEKTFSEIVKTGHPWINLHRAHRKFAFQKANEKIGTDTAYFAGYMGGELLMGIYYDDLVFTNFLTGIWEGNSKEDEIDTLLERAFIKKNVCNEKELITELNNLKTLDPQLSKFEQQFFSLFEIGVPHHSQDLELASKYFDYPIPFFLDIDFLEALFRSKYSFQFTDNKTKNLFKRYRLYKFNLEIQHLLYKELDDVPFAKKGEYNTKEFRKGLFFWTCIKAIRFILNKKKYPPSYQYTEKYKAYIISELEIILKDSQSEIHQIYDLEKAISKLKNSKKLLTEKDWHPFTNILMMYLNFNHIKSKNIVPDEI